jgi:uncharacterized protein YerC
LGLAFGFSGTRIDYLGGLRYVWAMDYSELISAHGIGRLQRRSKDIARAIILNPDRTYQDIADEHGITRQRVGMIARRLDIARRAKGGIENRVGRRRGSGNGI